MELFLVLPDGACEGQNGHPHAGSAISGFRAIRGCLQGFLGLSPLTQQPGPEGRRSWARRADSVQQPPCPVGRAPHPPPAGVPREFLPHAISCPGRAPQPSATIRPQPGLPAQPDFTHTHTNTHTHVHSHAQPPREPERRQNLFCWSSPTTTSQPSMSYLFISDIR